LRIGKNIERVITYLLSIIISASIVFIVPRLIPGNPILRILSSYLERGGTGVDIEKLVEDYKHLFGLDEDLFTQYIKFLSQTFQGNLGFSIVQFPRPVIDVIAESLPWTIGLLFITASMSWIIGTLLGLLAGWKGESSIFSKIFVIVAILSYAIPYYIFAIILLFLFALTLHILPAGGAYSVGMAPGFTLDFFIDCIKHATLPALSIILASLGWWFLSMRSMILTIKDEDFILMAEVKGLKRSYIMWKYAFRNAILPQFTGLALSLGSIVGGALLTEVIFSYPGIGWILYQSIRSLDYPVIQGCVMIIIFSVCTANLLMDLLYPLLDPRIGREES
jgi:peptide/nickel transport system permease protein